MRTLTSSEPVASPPAARPGHTPVERGCGALLDGAVVAMATWTVVYHVCLLLRLGVWWAVGFELLALAAWTVLRRAIGGPEVDAPAVNATPAAPLRIRSAFRDAPTVDRSLGAVVVATAVGAAVGAAVGGVWTVVAVLWLASATAGAALAALRLRRGRARPDPTVSGGSGRIGAGVALGWAVALAVLALVARRSNPDDLYYVNLAQWVAANGTFPLRDTIFSDLVWPMSSWPPIASYDALAGTLAYLGGVRAATVVYLVVPPVATFLSVLALWRLQRQWRIRAAGTALSLALVFLLFDGGPGYAAPGNLFLTRIWQGKVILLAVGVPVLLVAGLRFIEEPSRRRIAWLFVCGVAATGLTTTAMFLVPLIAAAVAVPLLLRRPVRALAGAAALAAYPFAAGVVTLAVGGRSADLFATRRLFRFDPAWFGPEILRYGPIAAVAVLAVLAGALVLPRRDHRVVQGVLATIVGVTFLPGVTWLAFDLVGLGPTLWRVSWIVPIAALVGALGVRIGSGGRNFAVRAAVPVAVAAVLVATGVPIWSDANAVTVGTPQWKVGYPVTTQRAIAAASPGDILLAPQGIAVTTSILTTEVKTVAPRDYFMDYLADEPGFHYAERQTLLEFVDGEFLYATEREEVARALDVVGVDQVCIGAESYLRDRFLRREGFRPVTSTATHTCYRRTGPVGPASDTVAAAR